MVVAGMITSSWWFSNAFAALVIPAGRSCGFGMVMFTQDLFCIAYSSDEVSLAWNIDSGSLPKIVARPIEHLLHVLCLWHISEVSHCMEKQECLTSTILPLCVWYFPQYKGHNQSIKLMPAFSALSLIPFPICFDSLSHLSSFPWFSYNSSALVAIQSSQLTYQHILHMGERRNTVKICWMIVKTALEVRIESGSVELCDKSINRLN